VRVEDWVPHADLMPLTDVLVTTGGAGTVMTALAAGVPMVVVPTEWDKPENAQRVVEAGAGIRISPLRLNASRLRRAIERILNEPGFRDSARRMQEGFRGLDGIAESARLLSGLAASVAKHEPVPVLN
jgi:UDP:flavonoid glycosyltransferase YjiC (YdhE family)